MACRSTEQPTPTAATHRWTLIDGPAPCASPTPFSRRGITSPVFVPQPRTPRNLNIINRNVTVYRVTPYSPCSGRFVNRQPSDPALIQVTGFDAPGLSLSPGAIVARGATLMRQAAAV